MASQMMLLEECLPMNALSLGSLVESIQSPVMDTYVPKEPLPPDAVLSMPAKSFQALMSSGHGNSLRLALTRLFDVGHSSENESAVSLDSTRANRYVLKQPRELFRNLCLRDEKARQWLNDGIQAGSKSYLVVELQTVTNPKITTSDVRKTTADVGITVPTSIIATGGADVLGLGAALDTSAEMGLVRSNESSKTFEVEGEMIFAVGYKKVIWKSLGFKRKEVDKATLEKEITWSLLGKKRSREDEDEMVSVDLADNLDSRAAEKLFVGGDGDEDSDMEDEDEDDIVASLKAGIDVEGQTYYQIPSAAGDA